MSVLDHDRIGTDDFAGEVVVHLPSLQPISLDDSIEKQPAVILPLKRPNKPTDGPYVVSISLLIFESLFVLLLHIRSQQLWPWQDR